MTGRDSKTTTFFTPLPPGEGIGVRRSQVDHPLPPGEGRGEGTALHVESCCGRGHSTLVTSASGSVEASPSPPIPSPGGRGVTRFEDLCPRITNGHLDTGLTRLTPMPGEGPGVRVITSKRSGCRATSPRHWFTSDTLPSPQPSPGGRGRSMRAESPVSLRRDRRYAPVRTSRSVI